MSSCERCWRESATYDGTFDTQADAYAARLKINEGRCTPEDQAGPYATACDKCGRKTRHQHTRECMHCGDWPEEMQP